jgi:chloride channel protein, CIC family
LAHAMRTWDPPLKRIDLRRNDRRRVGLDVQEAAETAADTTAGDSPQTGTAALCYPLARMDLKALVQRAGIWPHTGVRALGRGIWMAALVGVVAGAGAIVFHMGCLVVAHYTLGRLAGYEQGGPANELEMRTLMPAPEAQRPLVPWMLLIIPTVGGLVSGWIVYTFAPEAEGHGTDAAIDAYHNKRGVIRPRVPIVKLVASAITLGTGGSGGREGPIAQIGAGFGSYLATKMKLSDMEKRTLLAAGVGAGIGAIFHAPLAGAIFAIEVLYRDPDFEAEALIPSFIATTVSYSVFSLAFGLSAFKPLFAVTADLSFTQPLQLLGPLTVLALTMSVASFVFVKTFYGLHDAFKKLPIPPTFKPMIGGFLTAAVALGLYYAMAYLGPDAQRDGLSVLSFGYGFLQKLLTPGATGVAIVLMLVVGFGKALTTSLTIGSGGSGGVFGPSMVVGGSLGAVIGALFHQWLPNVVGPNELVMFTILGMASFFAAAANTPVSTLIMVSEMTNSYALLLPSMWVCALSYLLSRGWTIYREQVDSRIDSPAHRGDFIIDILKGLTVRHAMAGVHRKFMTVPLDMPLPEMSRLITSTLQSSFPVVDAEGHYYGLFSLNDIRQFLYDSQVGDLAVAHDLATVGLEPLTLDMDLSDAISRFAQGRFDELPVVNAKEPEHIVGLLRRQDLIAVYDKRLLDMRKV